MIDTIIIGGETGLYNLQSRYYDPEVGRFIIVDEPEIVSISSIDGSEVEVSLYAYCFINPIVNSDPTGYLSFTIRRWMISIPLDAPLMLIPVIGWVFAPMIGKTMV